MCCDGRIAVVVDQASQGILGRERAILPLDHNMQERRLPLKCQRLRTLSTLGTIVVRGTARVRQRGQCRYAGPAADGPI